MTDAHSNSDPPLTNAQEAAFYLGHDELTYGETAMLHALLPVVDETTL